MAFNDNYATAVTQILKIPETIMRALKYKVSACQHLPLALWLVMRALRSQRPGTRLKAVLILRRIRSRRTTAALIFALDDNLRDVRLAAVQALGEIGDHFALPWLSRKANHDPDREVRSEAILAIGSIAHPASAGLLIDLVRGRRDLDPAIQALASLLAASSQLLPEDQLKAVLALNQRVFARRKLAESSPDRIKNSLCYARFLADFEIERRKGNVRTGRSGLIAQ